MKHFKERKYENEFSFCTLKHLYLRKIVEKIHIFIVETIWMRIYGFGGNHEAEN